MDFHLFGSVLWRFRYLVAAGLVVALLLSVLTVAKLPSFAPRTPPVYASHATLLVTQTGFPWGSAVQQYSQSPTGEGGLVPAGDLTRLTNLANLYVQLANSDLIGRLVAREAPGTKISATQNYSISPSYYSSPLPILTITGTGKSHSRAIAGTQAGVDVLTQYLKDQQRAAGIGEKQRVLVEELQRPVAVSVVNGTKKTLPIVVFITVMLAVTGLAFVLENIRPRPRSAAVMHSGAEPLVGAARRTA